MSDISTKPLICNCCLEPIGLGLVFTWWNDKPYHINCRTSPRQMITRAQADAEIAAAVAAEREACAKVIEDHCEVVRSSEKQTFSLSANARE